MKRTTQRTVDGLDARAAVRLVLGWLVRNFHQRNLGKGTLLPTEVSGQAGQR